MPDLCTISGTVYTGAGAAMPAGEKVLFVYEVWKDGVLVSDKSFDVYTTADGAVSFTVPRDSTVRLSGMIRGLTEKKYLTVPDAETAQLEDLLPAISPPSSAVSQAAFNAAIEDLQEQIGNIPPPVWGGLTGDLADQTDLQEALDAKADLVGGTVPDNQIPASIARDTEVTAAVRDVYTAEVDADETLDIGAASRALIEIDTSLVRPVIELPPLADMAGRQITFVMNDDTNGADIDGSGSEMIGQALMYNFDAVRDSFVTLTPGVSAWRVTGKG